MLQTNLLIIFIGFTFILGLFSYWVFIPLIRVKFVFLFKEIRSLSHYYKKVDIFLEFSNYIPQSDMVHEKIIVFSNGYDSFDAKEYFEYMKKYKFCKAETFSKSEFTFETIHWDKKENVIRKLEEVLNNELNSKLFDSL